MAVSFERFEEITAELTDRLPEELFRELSGGVMAREQTKLHPAGLNGDLYILGEYHVHPHLGRFVVLYYGSFMACLGWMEEERLRERMWKVLRHEFLHHLESLAGEKDLAVEDAKKIAVYCRERQENT